MGQPVMWGFQIFLYLIFFDFTKINSRIQSAVCTGLQQWRQCRYGWRQAGLQLPPVETAGSTSLPLVQLAVGFIFIFFIFCFSQYCKCEITDN
jgi:hypothetical protein